MNNILLAAITGGALLATGCATTDETAAVDGRLYAGAGGLISRLEPDTDAVDGVEVDDSSSGGANLLLGYDIDDRFSIEGNVARLGEANLSPEGQIEYDVGGISALGYVFSSQEDRARREGLSGFGRLGVGRLGNGADVDYERVNDVNLLVGLGVEYGFDNGVGVRGELVVHDEDVAYAQLALLYRIGDHEPRRRRPAEPVVVTEVPPSIAPAPPIATRSTTPPPEAVVIDGPQAGPQAGPRDGVLDGVVFEPGSDTLTAGARQVLDGVAATLIEYPLTRVAIEAHTDNTGPAESNLQLSRRRALAVASHLVGQGVEGDRLVPRAFGESRPSVPNTSAEARSTNRRVELSFLP